jgi:PAS domain S-box-containing protein
MTDAGTAAKLRAAFELSPAILAVSDLETGALLEINEAFLRITGWTREEIIGRPIPELRGLETLRAGGTVRDVETRLRTKSGSEVVAIANADLVVVDGRACAITALIDVTARTQLERARLDVARVSLATVKRLVERHGGSVSADSAGPRRRRVLIVEDDADARESLQLLLELAGHEVETAEDGPRGLEKLARFRPEVALIDLGLPGIDGYEMARTLRRMREAQATRLIALTGDGQAEDRRRALDAGFDVHLTTPVDPERLQRLLVAG